MANNPEINVKNDCNNELQKIDWEISIAQKRLGELKSKKEIDGLTQNQITELETKLKELEDKREKIISQTQSCLKWEKVWKEEKKEVANQLDNTNLSWEQKKEVKSALDKQTWNSFDLSKIEWGILWIILAILQAFSWWFKSYTEVWEDWKEIKSSKVNYEKITSKDKEAYVKEASIIAKKIQKEYWIPWEVTVSQSILESGWWNSALAKKYWNYFWIKSFWKWKSVTMMTNEEINWKKVKIKDWFKEFKNMEESFYWYAEFLTSNPRYKKAFAYAEDINPKPKYYPNNYIWLDSDKFAREIAKGWYATDGKYAQKVIWLSEKIRDVA